VIVRLERPADRAASIEVERAAFGQPLEAEIVEAVRGEHGAFALVAELDGEVVGHVQLSVAHVGEDEVIALGPIGVMPAHQGRGIGTALVAASLEEARVHGAIAVILLGSPAYYGARGFVPASGLALANPFAGTQLEDLPIAEEHFQIAVLDETACRRLSGEVRWHPAFG
jgi:putative acetyltransferase